MKNAKIVNSIIIIIIITKFIKLTNSSELDNHVKTHYQLAKLILAVQTVALRQLF